MKHIFLISFFLALSTMAFAANTVTCQNSSDVKGVMNLIGPVDKTFSETRCVEWDIKNGCYTTSGPEDSSDLCDCLKKKDDIYHYQSFHLMGQLSIEEIQINFDFDLNRYSNKSELSGTQFGTINNVKYVANFMSGDDPFKDLTIRLQRMPLGGQYSDTLFNKIDYTIK